MARPWSKRSPPSLRRASSVRAVDMGNQGRSTYSRRSTRFFAKRIAESLAKKINLLGKPTHGWLAILLLPISARRYSALPEVRYCCPSKPSVDTWLGDWKFAQEPPDSVFHSHRTSLPDWRLPRQNPEYAVVSIQRFLPTEQVLQLVQLEIVANTLRRTGSMQTNQQHLLGDNAKFCLRKQIVSGGLEGSAFSTVADLALVTVAVPN